MDMSLITWPEKHRDQESVTKRAGVLKAAFRQGVLIPSLTTICPMSERNVRRAIGEELAFKRQNGEHCCQNYATNLS